MALKFTVHVVRSFIKGNRKCGVIPIKHSRDIKLAHLQWNNVHLLPVTATCGEMLTFWHWGDIFPLLQFAWKSKSTAIFI